MAYDPHSAYEPPRRAYLERAPPPSQSHPNDYQDYAASPYDQNDHQGYQHHQNWAPHEQHEQHNSQMDQAYDQGYAGGAHPVPPAPQQQRAAQERSYDPRYQTRAPRGPPQGRGPPPPQRKPVPQGTKPYQGGQPRPPPPHNGYPQQGQPPREQYGQHHGYPPQGRPPPREQYGPAHAQSSGRPVAREQYMQANDPAAAPHNGYGHSANDTHTYPEQRPKTAPGRSSMDDWKARERARLYSDAKSPEIAPYNNAFPAFGQNIPMPDSAQSHQNHRGGNDQGPRPKTAGGVRGHAPSDYTYGHPPDLPSNGTRPPQDLSNEGRGRPYPGPVPGHHVAAPYQAHPEQDHPQAREPAYDQYPGQWPIVQGHATSPPHANSQAPAEPPFDRGYGQGRTAQGAASSWPIPDSRPPAAHSMDAGYESRQHIPVNGHNAQSFKPSPHQLTSQPPQNEQNPTLAFHHGNAEAQKDHYASQTETRANHSRAASLDDIYNDYNAEPPEPTPGIKRAPTNREEEIEAEMPDFDSAAPAQTSSLHKRLQTLAINTNVAPPARAETAPPPMPPQMPPVRNGLPQSSSLPDVRHDPTAYQNSGRIPPGAMRGPPPRAMTGGPYGGSATPGPYGQPAPYGPPHGQDPRYQQGHPMPPQPPFFNGQRVRHSLDDGQPVPQQPHQQPPYGNGQPPPRPGYGPGRPDLERHGTGQSTWSAPEQERYGSAPPPRQGLGPPGGLPPPAPPLTQQRSAPGPPGSANPDALPHHPTPVRPGLMNQGPGQSDRPPPVRQHGNPPAANSGTQHQHKASDDIFAHPVTHAELDRLRAEVDAGPYNPKQVMIYVKKLVEASFVLATDNGRADPKTTAKNREKWTLEAHKRLKRVVQAGYPPAQFYLADCHGSGLLGLEIDPKEAFKLYQAAAKGNHPEAAYRTAVCCELGAEEGGGTNRDYPKAVQWYRRAAALGDGPAMYKLGAILLKGLLGQQRNVTEAVTWLKRGAEKADQDHPHALHELARLHESSNTDPEIRNKIVADDAYALELFQKAAGLGHKFSQFRLGQAYEYGSLGLPVDNRASIAYYTKAAAQGEHQAELALSGWYLTGAEGILEHSDTEAYLWARKAAGSEPPLAKAMFAMGYFTENGIGCPRNLDEARKWYGRAASYKFPKAFERLEELKKAGSKSSRPAPANGKLTRKDQKRDEENCVVM